MAMFSPRGRVQSWPWNHGTCQLSSSKANETLTALNFARQEVFSFFFGGGLVCDHKIRIGIPSIVMVYLPAFGL